MLSSRKLNPPTSWRDRDAVEASLVPLFISAVSAGIGRHLEAVHESTWAGETLYKFRPRRADGRLDTPLFIRPTSMRALSRRYSGPRDLVYFWYYAGPATNIVGQALNVMMIPGRVYPAAPVGSKQGPSVRRELVVGKETNFEGWPLFEKQPAVEQFLREHPRLARDAAVQDLSHWKWGRLAYDGRRKTDTEEEKGFFNASWKFTSEEIEADPEGFPTGSFIVVDRQCKLLIESEAKQLTPSQHSGPRSKTLESSADRTSD